MTDKLKYIRIELEKGLDVKNKTIENYSILDKNDKYLVINDLRYTTIRLKKDKYSDHETILNEVNVVDWSTGSLSGLGYFLVIYLYTTSSLKVAENRINKEINKFLQGKCGQYGFGKEVKISLK